MTAPDPMSVEETMEEAIHDLGVYEEYRRDQGYGEHLKMAIVRLRSDREAIRKVRDEVALAANSRDWPTMTADDYREGQKAMRQWLAALDAVLEGKT